MKNKVIAIYLTLSVCTPIIGQNALLKDLVEDDIRSIEALALYPTPIKKAILEVAGQPEILVRIENIRKRTQGKFEEIIAPYNRGTQKDFYEISRFPELVAELAENPKKTNKELKSFAEKYPEEVRSAIPKLGRKRYDDLQGIHQLNKTVELAFQSTISSYPPYLKSNLDTLLSIPEVLDALMRNFRSTVLVGALYTRDPEQVLHIADSIQQMVASMQAKELAAWKASLESDPRALEDLTSAASDFIEDQGSYSSSYPRNLSEHEFIERYNRYYFPYSYWFGYPWWYSYPFWNPRPYWFYSGFYFGPRGQVVIFGFPSWYFVDWYYSQRYHHYRYPYLSNCYIKHHEGHRSSSNASTSRIRDWVNENEKMYKSNWLQDDSKRVERLRNYGARDVSNLSKTIPRPERRGYTEIAQPSRTVKPRIEPTRRNNIITRKAPEYHNQILRKPVRPEIMRNRNIAPKQTAPSVRKKNIPTRKRNSNK